MWLVLLLIVVPVVEIALFIRVGGMIGLWPTIAVVIATAVAGGVMLRRQGLRTLAALQTQLVRGADPSPLLLEGALILLGGALLLTPGFFTDAAGLALLVPPVRAAVARWLGPRLARGFVITTMGHAREAQGWGPRPGAPGRQGPIDAEYREVETPPAGARPPPPRD